MLELQRQAEKHPTAFGPAPAGQDRAVSVAARGPGGIVVEHVEGKGQDSAGLSSGKKKAHKHSVVR